MRMNFEVAASWSSRSSSSTTSSGLSREESFRRQAAIMNSSRSSSSTTSSGASREESYRRQAVIIVNQLNKGVEQAKIDYMNAQSRGDQAAMNRAAKQAEDLRKQGATLGANEDTAATKALKNYYEQSGIKVAISTRSVNDLNKGIYQAKNDYAWAKANNDQAGMAAAAQLANNLRALGGTVSSDASLTDARKMAYQPQPTNTHTSSLLKTMASTVLDFVPGVGNVKSGVEAATGKDYVTGQDLTWEQRGLALTGVFIGGFAKVAKAEKTAEAVYDATKAEQTAKKFNPDTIRNVGNDILDRSEAAGGHLLEKHVAQRNEDLIKRANQEGVDATSFKDKSTALKATQENIRQNADKITNWLNDSKSDPKLVIEANHNYEIGFGVSTKNSGNSASKQVTYGLTDSKIILTKDSSQQNGYKILTGFPVFK